MKKRLKKFPICAGLVKIFVVCVCVVKWSKERNFYSRRSYEENCNLC